MLHSIRIRNFKAFADSFPIEIKPITLFCGTNSCGKSSLLQSILLWKQSIESRNYDQSLLMNGRLIHLGTFDNVLHGQAQEKPLVFEFVYEFNRKDVGLQKYSRRHFPLSIFMRETLPETNDTTEWDLTYRVEYSVALKSLRSVISSFTRTVSPVDMAFNVSARTSKGKTIDGTKITIKALDDSNEFIMKWKNLSARYHKKGQPASDGETRVKLIDFINLVPAGIIDSKGEEPEPHETAFLFYRLAELLRFIFGSFTYLGPLREEPARRYIYEDEVVEIGVKGENAAYIYLAEADKTINNHYFYNPNKDSFEKKSFFSLRDSVDHWFSIMGIHSFSVSSESEIIRLLLNSSSSSEKKVNIADVGFGVSQIFPIILEGLRMDPGQTLLLEQPEIHLHPKLQMQLADYIVSLALSGKRVILETHSDHIVNRLVRRMAEDESGDLARLMGVYFVSQGEAGSSIDEVKLSPTEGIVNWPDEFFDQAAMEQQRIMRALIANRKRVE